MSEGGGKPLFPEDFGYLGTGTNRDAPLPEVSREVLLSQAEKQLAQMEKNYELHHEAYVKKLFQELIKE